MNTIDVYLTDDDRLLAARTAFIRIGESLKRELNHATSCKKKKRRMLDRVIDDFLGACGEIAVAKAVGAPLTLSVNTFHTKPDLLSDIEVRATDRPEGRLIVRDNDADDRRYVLVITAGDNASIVGWTGGKEAKQDKWLDDPYGQRESWFVPQGSLHPIGPLIESLRK